jgi:hypothetical protein
MVSLCFNSIFCPVVVTMNAYAYQEGISFVLAPLSVNVPGPPAAGMVTEPVTPTMPGPFTEMFCIAPCAFKLGLVSMAESCWVCPASGETVTVVSYDDRFHVPGLLVLSALIRGAVIMPAFGAYSAWSSFSPGVVTNGGNDKVVIMVTLGLVTVTPSMLRVDESVQYTMFPFMNVAYSNT